MPPAERTGLLTGWHRDHRTAIGRVERILALRSFSGWKDLPPADLAVLASIARPLRFERGERLLEEGSPVDTLYLVVSGRLSLRRDGRELGRYGPRTAVGGLGAFAGDPRGYDCVALEDSVVLAMDAEDIEEVLEERFPILLRVLRELARNGIEVRRRIAASAGFPVQGDPGESCPARALDPVERIFYLRQNLAFGPGRIDSIAALAMGSEELRCRPDEVLWRAGDRPEHLIVVVCGTVTARTTDGVRFGFGAGDLIGALDAVADVPRWYDATVEHGLVGLRLDRDATLDLWEDHPDLGLEVLRALARGLLELLTSHSLPIDTLPDGSTLIE